MYFTGSIDYDPESSIIIDNNKYMKIVFPARVNTVPFDISIIGDDILEQNETFRATIDHISLPYGVNLGNITTTEVTIIDDDGR